MAFIKRGFRDLYDSMAAELRRRAPTLTDYEEGSVVRSLFESFAVEIALLYEQMDLVYRAGFVETATGEHLDRVVAVLGITRNEPDFATGEVTFERDPGSREEILIPLGTLVTTGDDPERTPSKKGYVTQEERRLLAGETTVEVKVQAEERGPRMTTESETVVVMPRPIPGVKAVYNRKPIRFRGRDRETDEELRERAKNALLASGRASTTAIENALLALPEVRGVRVREDFPPPAPDGEGGPPEVLTGAGVVRVFVDGLSAKNAPRIRARLDEVRAAGVYVVLDSAVPVNVQAVFQIVPDPRLNREEREELEREVRDAIYHHVDRLRMGQPLRFAQLTREILNVKGVTDLADFRITTFRDAAVRAEGKVRLRKPENTPAVAIPARAELRTSTDRRFFIAGDAAVQMGAEDREKVVDVLADLPGREGELLRTGAAVAWDPVVVEDVALAVDNEEPILLPRQTVGPDQRVLEAALEQRLVPDSIRVAAERKTLSVQVHVLLRVPDPVAAAGILAAVRERLAAIPSTTLLPAEPGVPLDDRARQEAREALQRFVSGLGAAVPALADRVRSGPEEEVRGVVEAAVQGYFKRAVETPVPDPKTGDHRVVIREDELEAAVREAVTDFLGSRTGANPATALAATLAAELQLLLDAHAATFPAAAVRAALDAGIDRVASAAREKATAALETATRAFRDAQTELARRQQTLSNRQAESLRDPADADARNAFAEAQTAVKEQQGVVDAAQTAVDEAQRAYDQLVREQARSVAEAHAAAEDAVGAAVRAGVMGALAAALSPAALADDVRGRLAPDAFELGIQMRTVSFDGEIRVDVPRVIPSFVEDPVAESVFVYDRLLPLQGTLSLAQPLTATDEERRTVRAEVRQRLTDYVDGLRPEENVDLARVQALVEAHERVLRASFVPAAELRARIRGSELEVGAFERVVLGGEGTLRITD